MVRTTSFLQGFLHSKRTPSFLTLRKRHPWRFTFETRVWTESFAWTSVGWVEGVQGLSSVVTSSIF